MVAYGLRIEVPVAARPVRAPQAGIGEAHPGAQHDHRRREQRAANASRLNQSNRRCGYMRLAYGGSRSRRFMSSSMPLG